MSTKQLTIFQHAVLELVRGNKAGYEPAGMQSTQAIAQLTEMGLIQQSANGRYVPIRGETYNYRGDRHTV